MKKTVNILVIDDNEIDQLIIGTHFKNVMSNTSIHEAGDGEDALYYLENCLDNFPDLIVVDINMPIMNGFEFLKKYEQVFWPQHPDTIITILSSSRADEDIEKSNEFSSLYGFISKPLNRESAKNLIDILST
jgi:CheY-like chemotaxis protein